MPGGFKYYSSNNSIPVANLTDVTVVVLILSGFVDIVAL